MAAISFYVGFIGPPKVLAWQSKAAFLIFLFFLVPILVYVLNQQRGAIERLEQAGFSGHPAIVESIGYGNGVGEEPLWLFKVDGEVNDVLDFYRTTRSHPGWKLTVDGDKILIFRRDGEKMVVAVSSKYSDISLMLTLSKLDAD
jgi:hypothetical protein